MVKIELNTGNTITVDDNGISSDLHEDGEDEYNHAIDGLESFLLALHCEGVYLNTPQIQRALETSLEAIANNI